MQFLNLIGNRLFGLYIYFGLCHKGFICSTCRDISRQTDAEYSAEWENIEHDLYGRSCDFGSWGGICRQGRIYFGGGTSTRCCSTDLDFGTDVLVSAYCPQGPQWSSFDKSTLEFICLLHCSILHLPIGFGGSFDRIFFMMVIMFFMLYNNYYYHYIVFAQIERKIRPTTILFGRLWIKANWRACIIKMDS